jgi:hypothetical protein
MFSFNDALRRLLSHPGVVEELLLIVFDEQWTNKFDLSALQQLPSDFLGPQHQRRQADVIWQVGIQESPGVLIVVIEVQTSVDRYMALRVSTYTMLLYERLVRQGLLSGSGQLPFVRVVVVYNGTRRWTAPRNLSHLVEPLVGMPPEVMPRFDYHVVELQRLARRGGRKRPPVLGAIALCESHPTLDRVKRVVRRLREWITEKEDAILGRMLAEYFSGYFLPKHLPGEDIPLLETLAEVEALMNDRAMLWYERWKQEGKEEGFREGLERGRQEGRQQGRQEGRQEGIQLGRQEGIQLGRQEGIQLGRQEGIQLGRQEGIQLGRQEGVELGRQEGFEQGRRRGEAELLLRLLRSKFGPVPKKIQARLRNAQPEQLLEWGERLVKANSLDEVFQ